MQRRGKERNTAITLRNTLFHSDNAHTHTHTLGSWEFVCLSRGVGGVGVGLTHVIHESGTSNVLGFFALTHLHELMFELGFASFSLLSLI